MYFSLFSDTSRFGSEGGYQTIGDVFKSGGSYAIVGLLTIFVVLAIIWGLLELFHLLSNRKPTKSTEPETATPAAPAPVATPAAPAADSDDEEIVAVIAAAIAAAQNENPLGSFRVVSFKRK